MMLIEVWCRRFHRRHWRALPLTDATRRRGYLAFRCERCHTLTIEHVRHERARRAARVVGSSRLRAENARLRAALRINATFAHLNGSPGTGHAANAVDYETCTNPRCRMARDALAGATSEDAQVDDASRLRREMEKLASAWVDAAFRQTDLRSVPGSAAAGALRLCAEQLRERCRAALAAEDAQVDD